MADYPDVKKAKCLDIEEHSLGDTLRDLEEESEKG